MSYFKVLIVTLLITGCSKGPGTKTVTPGMQKLETDTYIVGGEQVKAYPYSAKAYRLALIEGDKLTYTLFVIHQFGYNPDGSPRVGEFPEPETRVLYAEYNMTKLNDNNYQLDLIKSECEDTNKDPFKKMMTTNPVEIIYDNDGMRITSLGMQDVLVKALERDVELITKFKGVSLSCADMVE